MRNYFRCIFTALMGRDPFREGLNQAQLDLKKERAHACDLQNLINNLQERIVELKAKIQELESGEFSFEAQMAPLRKESMRLCRELGAAKKDLEETTSWLQRVQSANAEMELEKHNALEKQRMLQQLLDKTNRSIADLVSAMKGEDEEKVKMAVDYLSWYPPLSELAQRHLEVLRLYHAIGDTSYDENVNHE